MVFSFVNHKINFISILLSLIPLSFIAGNPAINLNIILIVIYALIIDKKKIFQIKLLPVDKLIVIFFLASLLTILFNNVGGSHNLEQSDNNHIIIKTFLFLRYLIFYFALRYYFEKNQINLNLFFITSSICVLFVCFDLFYQLSFGKDIFGYPIFHHKISGPFGEELIAGSYLQRFSLFLLITTLYLVKFKNKFNKNFFLYFFSLIIFLTIIISGNRIPFLLFLFIVFSFLLINKNLRKFFLVILITIPFVLYLVAKNNERVFNNFHGLYDQLNNITYNYFFNKDKFNPRQVPEQIYQFRSGIYTWYLNKTIGGGIKSFKFNCWDAHKKINNTWSCDTHPHNYYLEVLAELGLIGLLIVILIFISLLMIFFKKIPKNIKLSYNYVVYQVFFLLLLAEFFPIKSSGSFFSTFNASYIFLMMAIFVSISKKVNKKWYLNK